MSSDYKIRISESRAGELRAQAEALDISINTLMAQIVENQTVPAPASRIASPDEAAAYFLDKLEPEHRKLIEDCSRETQSHPASYLLGYIKLAHDQGNTAKMLPEAPDPTRSQSSPVALSNTACEWCHAPLENRTARFCPEPADGTESCGRQASLAVIRAARRKAAPQGLPMPKVMERTFRV